MTDFTLFVGPTKTGSSWIHAYLESRGDIALPRATKETFFFDKVHERGLDWYRAQFPKQDAGRMAEVAPSLFHKPEACLNVKNDMPDARIIVTWRDPIDRAVSHYFHYRKAGMPRRPLADAIQDHPVIIDAGRYDLHLPRWQHAFGTDRVHVLSYDLMKSEPEAFCRSLCRVMGIPFMPPSDALIGLRINAAGVPRSATAARIGRRGADYLRRMGLHGVVNSVKHTRLKSMLFSNGNLAPAERSGVRLEMAAILSPLAKSIEQKVAPSIPAPGDIGAH